MLALVRDEYWLKLSGRGAGKDGKADKLWKVGKSEEVGFKARKKLITRERECFTRVGRSRADDSDGVVCVSGAKDLRFIGREFHKQGEELQRDRSANLILVETG